MKIENDRPREAFGQCDGSNGRMIVPEPMNLEEDPLSHAQVLRSIRAAKRLHLPTGDALRALRRQIDED